MIKYVVVSDIHFGHNNTKTSDVANRLLTNLETTAKENKIDIIFIAGDLFDRLISVLEPEHVTIMFWFNSMLKLCNKYNIKLRLLKGTPSHDYNQPAVISELKNIIKYHVDYKYIGVLSIEKIEDLGLNILYIPDEWHPSTDITFLQVQELLKQNNLTQVDIVIMHGQFTYQLPKALAKVPKHSEINYLNITKGFIHPGHVHQHSEHDRIIAQGSFDRICHGDEGKKGFILVTIDDNKDYSYRFIVNKEAQIYKTIKIKTINLEDSINYLTNQLKNIRAGSFIRLQTDPANPILADLAIVQRAFPDYIFSKKTNENVGSKLIEEDMFVGNDYEPIIITPDNIIQLMMEEIIATHNLDEIVIQSTKDYLQEVLSES